MIEYKLLRIVSFHVTIHPLNPSRGKEERRRYRGHPYDPSGEFPCTPFSSTEVNGCKILKLTTTFTP
jgi:hypothetical protein